MFPWNMLFSKNKQTDFTNKMNPNDVQSFINQLFSQVIPENMQQMMNQKQADGFPSFQGMEQAAKEQQQQKPSNSLQATVFETHTDVYVRIPIKDPSSVKQMKIYHTSNQSIVEGIPEPGDRHVITLPATVKKKGASAHYKDETLEIKLQKNNDLQYSEIDVSGL